MKISVVTTFNEQGLQGYAQRMIDTFLLNWPREIHLYLYPENCEPVISDQSRVKIKRSEDVRDLQIFKKKWHNVPKANGDISKEPMKAKRRDMHKSFKWDAVRFSHKVYAIFDCVDTIDTDILFWMDADTVCHSPITLDRVINFCPISQDLGFLGREGKFSECGLYSMNLKSTVIHQFLQEFKRMYDQAETGIFTLGEWHDSYVFDAVRKKFPQLKENNWSSSLKDLRPSPGMSVGEGHPLINSEWGAYLDHLKGDRKQVGHSLSKDLKVARNENYWKRIAS
jgi:hypothetical protein